MMDYISQIDLQPRVLYRLKSRNLSCGVWNPGTHGFIGIREKFGDHFLFTEYHWDEPAFATARPLYEVDVMPEWMPLEEGRSLTKSGKSVIFKHFEEDHPKYDPELPYLGRQVYYHNGEEVDHNIDPSYHFNNRFLHEWMKPYDEQFVKEDNEAFWAEFPSYRPED